MQAEVIVPRQCYRGGYLSHGDIYLDIFIDEPHFPLFPQTTRYQCKIAPNCVHTRSHEITYVLLLSLSPCLCPFPRPFSPTLETAADLSALYRRQLKKRQFTPCVAVAKCDGALMLDDNRRRDSQITSAGPTAASSSWSRGKSQSRTG